MNKFSKKLPSYGLLIVMTYLMCLIDVSNQFQYYDYSSQANTAMTFLDEHGNIMDGYYFKKASNFTLSVYRNQSGKHKYLLFLVYTPNINGFLVKRLRANREAGFTNVVDGDAYIRFGPKKPVYMRLLTTSVECMKLHGASNMFEIIKLLNKVLPLESSVSFMLDVLMKKFNRGFAPNGLAYDFNFASMVTIFNYHQPLYSSETFFKLDEEDAEEATSGIIEKWHEVVQTLGTAISSAVSSIRIQGRVSQVMNLVSRGGGGYSPKSSQRKSFSYSKTVSKRNKKSTTPKKTQSQLDEEKRKREENKLKLAETLKNEREQADVMREELQAEFDEIFQQFVEKFDTMFNQIKEELEKIGIRKKREIEEFAEENIYDSKCGLLFITKLYPLPLQVTNASLKTITEVSTTYANYGVKQLFKISEDDDLPQEIDTIKKMINEANEEFKTQLNQVIGTKINGKYPFEVALKKYDTEIETMHKSSFSSYENLVPHQAAKIKSDLIDYFAGFFKAAGTYHPGIVNRSSKVSIEPLNEIYDGMNGPYQTSKDLMNVYLAYIKKWEMFNRRLV